MFKHILLGCILCFFVSSCKFDCACTKSKVKAGELWQDIGKPTSEENTYVIIKVEDEFVYSKDPQGVVRRVPEQAFLELCVHKQELESNL